MIHITLDLRNGNTVGVWLGTLAFWVIGAQAVNFPLFGGTLVPSTDILVPAFPLSAAGDFEFTVTWPVGLPPGFTYYYQFWISDPGGPQGLSASNGLAGTTP